MIFSFPMSQNRHHQIFSKQTSNMHFAHIRAKPNTGSFKKIRKHFFLLIPNFHFWTVCHQITQTIEIQLSYLLQILKLHHFLNTALLHIKQ